MKRKSLLSIFIFMMSLFILIGGAKAADLTISPSPYPEIEIYNNGSRLRQVNIIKDSTGARVFCMEMGQKTPNNSTIMTSNNNALEDSNIYAYIINNAPDRITPVNTLTYKKKNFNTQAFESTTLETVSINYLKTQFAIWYYQNNGVIKNDLEPKPDITDVVLAAYPGIKELVSDAKSSKNLINKELEVTIQRSNSMKLSSDGKTYESDKVTITSSQGGKITLSVVSNGIEGIKVYNEQGKEVKEISSGAKVIVKIPISSVKIGETTFKLSASTNGKTYKMYEYSASAAEIQSVGKLVSEEISASKEIEFRVEKQTTTKFSKISVVDQKELPGATLRILDGNKEPLMDPEGKPYEWVSTEEPHYIEGLAPGIYYLEEVYAPEGYVLSNELVEFEVKDDGSITEVVMENDLEVEVPDTLSSRSILLLAIGMIDIALGIGILLYVKKNKATE